METSKPLSLKGFHRGFQVEVPNWNEKLLQLNHHEAGNAFSIDQQHYGLFANLPDQTFIVGDGVGRLPIDLLDYVAALQPCIPRERTVGYLAHDHAFHFRAEAELLANIGREFVDVHVTHRAVGAFAARQLFIVLAGMYYAGQLGIAGARTFADNYVLFSVFIGVVTCLVVVIFSFVKPKMN